MRRYLRPLLKTNQQTSIPSQVITFLVNRGASTQSLIHRKFLILCIRKNSNGF